MKKALMLLLVVMVVVGIFHPATGQALKVFNWNKEGVSPFWKTPISSEADLKALFQDSAFREKLGRVLDEESVTLLSAAVAEGRAHKVVLPRGSEFDWMYYGAGQRIDADVVRWTGDHNLIGFVVPYSVEGRYAELFFGGICCNPLQPKNKLIVKVPPPRAEEAPGHYDHNLVEITPPATHLESEIHVKPSVVRQRQVVVVEPPTVEWDTKVIYLPAPPPTYRYVYAPAPPPTYAPPPPSYEEEYYKGGEYERRSSGFPPISLSFGFSWEKGSDRGSRQSYQPRQQRYQPRHNYQSRQQSRDCPPGSPGRR